MKHSSEVETKETKSHAHHEKATHSAPEKSQPQSTATVPHPNLMREIAISSSGINPTEFHAKVHESVKWVNHDSASHIVNYNVSTVLGYVPPTSSPDIPADGEYSYTFIVPGVYAYHLDNDMKKEGKVTVTA